MNKVDVIRVAQWLIATCAVSFSTCFAIIRFAYSDFETQRTNDVYHVQVDRRLEEIDTQLVEINRKVDRILLFKR